MPNDGIPPARPTPPAHVWVDVRRLTTIENQIGELGRRIDSEHHIHQNRIGELETRQIATENVHFSALRADVRHVLDALGAWRREAGEHRTRTDRMLELLLLERKIQIPEAP